MILDDSIVNDRNAINRMWMRIFLVWSTMSRPAGVANPYAANKRLTSEFALEVLEFSDCAPPRKATALKRGYAGRIVTSILKPFQRIQHWYHGWRLADETNYSAHLLSPIASPLAAEVSLRRPRAITARCSLVAHPGAPWKL
jgi:hypothetical protein